MRITNCPNNKLCQIVKITRVQIIYSYQTKTTNNINASNIVSSSIPKYIRQ